MKQTILLIEDNPDIIRINRSALTMRGYRVVEASTLEKGHTLLDLEKPDLVIMDIMMPDGDGLVFCEKVREKSDLPILFLSALGESHHIVNGLMRGGDDYLSKPYDLNVLLARVEALIRRTGRITERVLTNGTLTLDLVSQRALVNSEDALLTPKEFAILLCLVQNKGKKIQAEQLYKAVWGQPMADDTSAVKITVSRLRKKLEPNGFKIDAVRGAGYRFIAE